MAGANDQCEERAAREELERILSSETFRHAEKLSRFLRFTAETALKGEGERIKEYLVGVEVFERDDSYDPRVDPVVRVEARRLRAKLQEYYEQEGREDTVRILLPKGSYVPVFRRVGHERGAGKRLVERRYMVAAAAIATGILAYRFTRGSADVRVAVVPMRAYAPADSEEMQRLADRLTEAVLRELAREGSLSVVSWPTVSAYSAAGKKTPEVGRELRAGLVATIWARSYPDKVVVTAHLVDAESDRKGWAEGYEFPAGTVNAPEKLAVTIATEILRNQGSRR